ncbi:G1/S-specific cyclin-E2 isoform X1 [Ictalurus furcatus]|uniref:G1/S-specific cyclin-E2 isoform X1 n=1 Tax=Ictalurus furcatus TaxID=66913 RepID=UPI00234FD6C8|nr:G1/S-specific cyclin-E2 isoform X1 [Ictalurus furcatus]XP_053468747.1 G1/S-specific cyclin-E2 isoform X1 [Ictalurus furcatus]
MTRRSGRLQAKNENGATHTDKIAKVKKEQCNRKKALTKMLTSETQGHGEPGDYPSGHGNLWAHEGPCKAEVIIETPMDGLHDSFDQPGLSKCSRPSPLPRLSWGSSEDVWVKMLSKEIKYKHSNTCLERHPRLQPKMRAVLLDWLMEVCEAYLLHRQTFYLAQDFFDRFMLTQDDMEKERLQLIGITALFIASKIEEIYPPKLTELAYVTDGACLEEEILQMELMMLKALNWDLYPETVVSWMKLYIQMASVYDFTNVLVPQFSQETYIQITQLLDLCILDISSLEFKYGVLAAAAFCHFISFEVVQKVSGLTWEAVESCVNWMAPFAETMMGYESAKLKSFAKVSSEDRHNIQTHINYLSMLHEAQQTRTIPTNGVFPPTPPSSAEKSSTH